MTTNSSSFIVTLNEHTHSVVEERDTLLYAACLKKHTVTMAERGRETRRKQEERGGVKEGASEHAECTNDTAISVAPTTTPSLGSTLQHLQQ